MRVPMMLAWSSAHVGIARDDCFHIILTPITIFVYCPYKYRSKCTKIFASSLRTDIEADDDDGRLKLSQRRTWLPV